jgi:DNA mismatch repair ATPase MutS
LPWCRPVVTEKSKYDKPQADADTVAKSILEESSRALMIRNGRHPIDISNTGLIPTDGPSTHIPNDTYAAEGKNFTIVTGINGSGKVR